MARILDTKTGRAFRARNIIVFLLLILFLNALLTLYRLIPAGTILPGLLLTPEPPAALLLLWLLSRRSAGWMQTGRFALGSVLALLFLFGLGEAFYQAVYLEDFTPLSDLRFVPAFFNMVLSTEAFSSRVVMGLAVLVAVSGVAVILSLLLGAAARSVTGKGRIVAALLLLVWSGASVAVSSRPPLSVLFVRQLLPGGTAPAPQAAPPRPQASVPQAPSADGGKYALPGIEDADIHLFVVESYGHTLFSREAHRTLIMPVYRELERKLEASGYHVISSFVKSPAFGGRSWLADATILTGVWAKNQAVYDALFDGNHTSLVMDLKEAGYNTLLAAPGTTVMEDAWHALFPYDRALLQDDYNYRGRRFSFGGGMTDQFILNTVRRFREQNYASGSLLGQPGFYNYILVSSHVPFNVLPPYIEEWDRIGDGAVYYDYPRRIFDNNWLTGGEYPEGYTASIEYSLRVVTDYLIQYVGTRAVSLVMGDHQPRIPISERESTYLVPIHILSRDESLISGFVPYGFQPGLTPDNPPPLRMDELRNMLMKVALTPRVAASEKPDSGRR